VNHLVSLFKNSIVIKVSNSQDAQSWLDPWCGSGIRLSDVFLTLYALDRFKDCMISCMILGRWVISNNGEGDWDWRFHLCCIFIADISAMLILIVTLTIGTPRFPGRHQAQYHSLSSYVSSLEKNTRMVESGFPPVFPSFATGNLVSGIIAFEGCLRSKKIKHGVFCCAI
nr:nucleotide-binding alpha-beta plait domain-containing protein [Tanacetum cinerariifolium]